MITPVSLSDTCDSLLQVLYEKIKLYDISFEDSLAVIDSFKKGWMALYYSIVEPGEHPDLERFVVERDMDIPDSLEDLEE